MINKNSILMWSRLAECLEYPKKCVHFLYCPITFCIVLLLFVLSYYLLYCPITFCIVLLTVCVFESGETVGWVLLG